MNLFELIRTFRARRIIKKISINGAEICYSTVYDKVVRDYYLYVLGLIVEIAKKNKLPGDVVLGELAMASCRSKSFRKIFFQIEHTLVKPGGRGVEEIFYGNIPIRSTPEINYLVRIQKYKIINEADAIVEYSMPNIINIRSCLRFKSLLERTRYVAPIVYTVPTVYSIKRRDLELISLFGDVREGRRNKFYNALKARIPSYKNIQGKFDGVDKLYSRTKILINIRQTDHHDTLEELRILPALISGVVVISEDAPLREALPYEKFIIWAELDEIYSVIEDVHDNYEEYFSRIFGAGDLFECIKMMEKMNNLAIKELLELKILN